MSLNSFMHRRNIYRTKPNFSEMAKTYPSFAAYVKTDSRGKAVFDYSDRNALRQLTKTLLKKDFGLHIDIPEDRLIPTVPQRLNYILFVEDLMTKLFEFLQIESKEVIGLDVGTGCAAIFPLIGCTINKNWNFVATDIDPKNIETASNNVHKNDLNHRIKVVECNKDNDWSTIIFAMNHKIHFLMTNPPFFSDQFNDSDIQINDESNDSKRFQTKFQEKRHFQRKKSSANTSDPIESVVDGGEVEFVSKIIEKSLELKDKVMIYSSMCGKKQSFNQLKDIIKSYVRKEIIRSFVCTEFCQGFTKRWGIAWTFIPNLNLKEVVTIKSVKSNSSLIYYLPPIMKGIDYNINSVSDKIESLLKNDLKIDSFEVKKCKKRIEFRIKANTNVWTNQRRRKREIKRKLQSEAQTESHIIGSNDHSIDNHNKSNEDMDVSETQAVDKKRSLDESEPEDNEIECNSKKNKINFEYSGKELFLLDASLLIKREKLSIFIEMQTKELAQNKESTYQLFQYFKNNLI